MLLNIGGQAELNIKVRSRHMNIRYDGRQDDSFQFAQVQRKGQVGITGEQEIQGQGTCRNPGRCFGHSVDSFLTKYTSLHN